MKKFMTLGLCAAMALSACASQPEAVAASYVSPTQYSDMNCRQLNAEAQRVSAALSTATGRQKQAAESDAAVTAAALILFWPAAFFIKGDDNAPELARLKGEAEAVTAAARARGC